MNKYLAALAMTGCTTIELDGPDAQGYRWQKDGPSGTPNIRVGSDVYLNCGFTAHAQACSVIRGSVCDVYLPDGYTDWMKAHELRHCAGWRHPDPLRR